MGFLDLLILSFELLLFSVECETFTVPQTHNLKSKHFSACKRSSCISLADCKHHGEYVPLWPPTCFNLGRECRYQFYDLYFPRHNTQQASGSSVFLVFPVGGVLGQAVHSQSGPLTTNLRSQKRAVPWWPHLPELHCHKENFKVRVISSPAS